MNEVTVVLRLLIAAFCGGVIGLDREKINQAAGLRTYMLVSTAGALTALLSIFISENVGYTDLGRIPAAFISGMGFLGAGAIHKDANTETKGITTAAGLWMTAVCGLCFGMGMYFGGAVAFIISVVVIVFMNKTEIKIEKKRDIKRIYIEMGERKDLKHILKCVSELGGIVSDMKIEQMDMSKGGGASVTMLLDEAGATTTEEMLNAISELGCVSFAVYI